MIIPEGPPIGESQANGRVEEAGKTIREYAKVYKDKIEYEIKETLPSDATIVQWMLIWAAMVGSRYKVGADGKTVRHRMKDSKDADARWWRCRLERRSGRSN